MPRSDVDSRVVVVTSRSSGIGAAASHEFRKAGWTTVAIARQLDSVSDRRNRGSEVATLNATVLRATELRRPRTRYLVGAQVRATAATRRLPAWTNDVLVRTQVR